MRRILLAKVALVAMCVLAAPFVQAKAKKVKVDKEAKAEKRLMRRYGGVLARDCLNYMQPELRYLGDTLIVQDRGEPLITGRNVKAVPRHFGTTPPPEFETALSSDVNGEKMVFVFYRNSSGLYASVEGGPTVMKMLPEPLKGARVRHCDPKRNAVPAPQRSKEIKPPELLSDPSFRLHYLRVLGSLSQDQWLTVLDGPSSLVKQVRMARRDFQLLNVCKTNDCDMNNMTLLYDARSNAIYAKVLVRGQPIILGEPAPAVAAALERSWKAYWGVQ